MAALLPLALQLQADPRIALCCLGFTTARSVFAQAGLQPLGSADLLEPEDEPWLQLARTLLEQPQHPAISQADALAYYALGIKDLAAELGLDQALDQVREQGRRCFRPRASSRRFLEQQQPDLLITSTCPRSELALQQAAHDLGIASLAIGDLFLLHEWLYVCRPDYACHLSVIAEPVRQQLLARGCRSQIHIGGNPAFDTLLDPSHRSAARDFRAQLGIKSDQRLVLWASHPAVEALTGRQFVDPQAMLELLEQYVSTRPGVRVLIRQHPSVPLFAADLQLRGGWICPPELPIEVCLQAVDQVVVEVSTVGLQAALLGLPVVTFRAGGHPPYAELGLAVDVAELEELPAALDAQQLPQLDALGYPLEEPAADRLMRLCCRILEIEP